MHRGRIDAEKASTVFCHVILQICVDTARPNHQYINYLSFVKVAKNLRNSTN